MEWLEFDRHFPPSEHLYIRQMELMLIKVATPARFPQAQP